MHVCNVFFCCSCYCRRTMLTMPHCWAFWNGSPDLAFLTNLHLAHMTYVGDCAAGARRMRGYSAAAILDSWHAVTESIQ